MALPPDDKKKPANKPGKVRPPAARTTPPPLDKSPAYSDARKAAIAQAAARQNKAADKSTAAPTTIAASNDKPNASRDANASAAQINTKVTGSSAAATGSSQSRGEYPETKGGGIANSGVATSSPANKGVAAPPTGETQTKVASGTNRDHKILVRSTTQTETKENKKLEVRSNTNRLDAPPRAAGQRDSGDSGGKEPMVGANREADAAYRRAPRGRRQSPPPNYRNRPDSPRIARPRRKMGPPPASSGKGTIVRRGRPVSRHTVDPATPHDSSPWGPLLIGLLLLAGVAWYAVKHYTPRIESDLARRSNDALAVEGLADAKVTIDGRTALLTGSVANADQMELAEQTVAATFGIRAVDNQLTVGSEEEVAVVERKQPAFSLTKVDDGIELIGTVSDSQYATAMENAANEHFGADRVNASISVESGTTNPGWMSAVNQLIPEMDKVDNGGFSIEDGTLTLTGSSNAKTKTEIGTVARELTAGQLQVENLIEAPEPQIEAEPAVEVEAEPEPEPEPEPEATTEPDPIVQPEPVKLPAFAAIRDTDGGIIVNGFMSAEGANQLIATLGTENSITNNINIDDRAETPVWTAQLSDALAALKIGNVANPAVTMTRSGTIKLRGVVESAQAKTAAESAISNVYGDELEIANDIEVVVPPPIPTLSPFASISAVENTVTITGLLPPATAKSISSSYRASGKSVIENVTRDERVKAPGWTEAFTQTLDSMTGVEGQTVIVNTNGVVILKGTVEDDATKQAAGNNITVLFGDSVSLRNDIHVTPTIVPADELATLFDSIDLSGIRFGSNSAELTDSSVSILDQVVDALNRIPDVAVEISGHTDSAGSYDYNLSLSTQRAETVRDYLADRGIDDDRLQSQGYGPSHPVASNETRAGRALNRRIEFKISGE